MAVRGLLEREYEGERGVGAVLADVELRCGGAAVVGDVPDADERGVVELRALEEALEVDAELASLEDVEPVGERPEAAVDAPRDGLGCAARELRLDEDVEFFEEHARLRRECGVIGEEVDGEVVIGLAREQIEVDVAGEFLAVALLDGGLGFLERVFRCLRVEAAVPDGDGAEYGRDGSEQQTVFLPPYALVAQGEAALPGEIVQ